MSLLNFELLDLSLWAVLELFGSGFLVVRKFSNKRRSGTSVLIRGRRLLTFFVQNAALLRVNTVLSVVVISIFSCLCCCRWFIFARALVLNNLNLQLIFNHLCSSGKNARNWNEKSWLVRQLKCPLLRMPCPSTATNHSSGPSLRPCDTHQTTAKSPRTFLILCHGHWAIRPEMFSHLCLNL